MELEVVKAHNGNDGLSFALNEKFSLIVLDIMLPGLDGFEIWKQIRKQEIYTPVLMLTSKSEEVDKVHFAIRDSLVEKLGVVLR